MTTASANQALAGAWSARRAFVEGPREGSQGAVRLTFLPDGVIVHADEVPVQSSPLRRGIGEWTAQAERLSYGFNVVLNKPSGALDHVVYVHGLGALAADWKTFAASGWSEVYRRAGQPLATNRAEVLATRGEEA